MTTTVTEPDVDVLIIGAGLSGIGVAYHLQKAFPRKKYVILESRDAIGGTWDLFRYPGIRSDSDMYTLGYRFRPWLGDKAIADGPSILNYVRDTAAEYGIDKNVRFHHRVEGADFARADALWTVRVRRTDTDEILTLTARFIVSSSGYYRYDEGYTPEFPGLDNFAGTVVHPQHWPEDLDYAGKQVAIIGSGATAVTLAPSMSVDAAHVTMVQRSPTYIVSAPAKDPLVMQLRRFLPDRAIYPIARAKNVAVATAIYQLCQRYPARAKAVLRKYQQRWLPDGYDLDTHFSPRYNPWDERLCLVPNGDFFREIRHGRVSIATGAIDTFTENGITLTSGEQVPADIVVTATGLNLLLLGGIELAIDGEPVDLANTMAYKGIMLSGLPNFAYIIGYTNASWTLKADLASEYICRVLQQMDEKGYVSCLPEPDPSVAVEPFLGLTSGYVQRAAAFLPKQGSVAPWKLRQNYVRDLLTLRHSKLKDGTLRFDRAGVKVARPAVQKTADEVDNLAAK